MDQNPNSSPNDLSDNPQASGCASAIIKGAIFSIVMMFLGSLLLPAIGQPREVARRTQCRNNLKQIGLALSNYHDVYGSFPPAYTTDADGNRLHSWRTLLLPYLDHQLLYRTIDLSKPWDDPANQKQFKQSTGPDLCYRCPSTTKASEITSYVAIVGKDGCFPPGESVSYRDIKDGSSNTLMVVESPEEFTIPWMAPYDFEIAQVLKINDKTKFPHKHGFQALLGDGTVRFISSHLDKATLKAITTRAGGETIGDF